MPTAAPVKPPSGQNIPVAPPKPPSSQNHPVLPPKPPSSQNIPVLTPKPAVPEKKRKKRTGVKLPVAAPAEPLPAAAPDNPLDFSSPAAAPPPAAEEFDVELVDAPIPAAPPPAKGFRPTLRNALMVGAGIGLSLAVFGVFTLVSMVVRWFSGG